MSTGKQTGSCSHAEPTTGATEKMQKSPEAFRSDYWRSVIIEHVVLVCDQPSKQPLNGSIKNYFTINTTVIYILLSLTLCFYTYGFARRIFALGPSPINLHSWLY